MNDKLEQNNNSTVSLYLEQLTWQQAEPVLQGAAVVLLPLGAASKQHGPHLLLSNDKHLAEALTERVAARVDVVVAPTIPFHFYPAFSEYPGSLSLRDQTARALVVDLCTSLALHGPKHFYVLNTGLSTRRPLRGAQQDLAAQGLHMAFTDWDAALDATGVVLDQPRGGHADEAETSLMLALHPGSVSLERAVAELAPRGDAPHFTREASGSGTYSPSGSWGDPTLASVDKGRALAAGLIDGICDDIQKCAKANLPLGKTAPPAG